MRVATFEYVIKSITMFKLIDFTQNKVNHLVEQFPADFLSAKAFCEGHDANPQ